MLTNRQLEYIADGSEGQELQSIWGYFEVPGGYPDLRHEFMTFEERREGFLWTIQRLLENGYVILPHWSDKSILNGTPKSQVAMIRNAFPSSDEGMENGLWFFPPGCPVGVLWDWPERNPESFID